LNGSRSMSRAISIASFYNAHFSEGGDGCVQKT
jgi:hypothetical protein